MKAMHKGRPTHPVLKDEFLPPHFYFIRHAQFSASQTLQHHQKPASLTINGFPLDINRALLT